MSTIFGVNRRTHLLQLNIYLDKGIYYQLQCSPSLFSLCVGCFVLSSVQYAIDFRKRWRKGKKRIIEKETCSTSNNSHNINMQSIDEWSIFVESESKYYIQVSLLLFYTVDTVTGISGILLAGLNLSM